MAASVRQALHHLETSDCDLGIIDLGLPDGSGFTICRRMKQMGRPVIFLSAVDDETTVDQGLDLGGDDYVTKPFRLQELLSRIRSVIRRYEPGSHSIVQIDDLTIDQKQAKVFRDHHDQNRAIVRFLTKALILISAELVLVQAPALLF